MNILLVSQCSKKALKETRRIIDQFAERTGDRTWQTAITEQGLSTLRKLLKKTARRNTSVACHWIRGRDRTELKWIVGNPRKFNIDGAVPTNVTGRDILRAKDENVWQTAEDIRLLACIAALFHDAGKANQAFQDKINPTKKTASFEPYRHEWVSLRIFEAFVTQTIQHAPVANQDSAWLTALSQLSSDTDQLVQAALVKDKITEKCRSPFPKLPPVAQAVAWLIVSHHKLLEPTTDEKTFITHADKILEAVRGPWNSPRSADDWSKADIEKVWSFPFGTPFCSQTWCDKVSRIASQALKRAAFTKRPWLFDPFTLHLSRLGLMLADHYYSSQNRVGIKTTWHDKSWGKTVKKTVYANTWREYRSEDNGKYNQTLDDHLIGVYHCSHQLVRLLPVLKESLPVITRHPELKKRTTLPRFAWQNKAYELAVSVRDQSDKQGFFGINVASTGMGKTFANAKIMYGLSDERKGCRFNVALGLRTLTLQTGDAFKELLRLDEEDLAVLIGSSAVQALHEESNQHTGVFGSESASVFEDQDNYVSYDGILGDGLLSKWLDRSPKIKKLVNAPLLVSTIDHLMPATEGSRGGKQIAPMLRLLSSDLVLDEPDDFGLEDLPALCRLVHWAGMLGSKVLLSSATLPPDLTEALFDAYLAGRKHYEKAVNVNPSKTTNVVCAWFDEFKSTSVNVASRDLFSAEHSNCMKQRAAKLAQQAVRRRVELVSLQTQNRDTAIDDMAHQIHASVLELHSRYQHKQPTGNAVASFGLVRMANIKPLVAVAQKLMLMPSPKGLNVHYCVYHSQFLLLQRSSIETRLDAVLNRKDPAAIWSHSSVQDAISKAPNEEHVFVVLGSPVTEVGRDHSYDWAVVEPSSIRSVIQLAGRVLRHDQVTMVDQPNIHLLNQNIRALRGEREAFVKPGFEGGGLLLKSHLLNEVLSEHQYQTINALPRVLKADHLDPEHQLVDLEHAALANRLWGEDESSGRPYASVWWKQPCHWTNHIQRRLPFRQHTPSDEYCFYLEEELDEPAMWRWHKNGDFKSDDKQGFVEDSLPTLAKGVYLWGGNFDYKAELMAIAERKNVSLADAAKQFGTVSLRKTEGVWHRNNLFGFFEAE
jgi:CRISPR-associated endonuclease/helicase Cas3